MSTWKGAAWTAVTVSVLAAAVPVIAGSYVPFNAGEVLPAAVGVLGLFTSRVLAFHPKRITREQRSVFTALAALDNYGRPVTS